MVLYNPHGRSDGSSRPTHQMASGCPHPGSVLICEALSNVTGRRLTYKELTGKAEKLESLL